MKNCLFVLAAGAAILLGAARDAGAQTIKACVHKSSQQVRIIDNAESCPVADTINARCGR